jgi:hypothetical protein
MLGASEEDMPADRAAVIRRRNMAVQSSLYRYTVHAQNAPHVIAVPYIEHKKMRLIWRLLFEGSVDNCRAEMMRDKPKSKVRLATKIRVAG